MNLGLYSFVTINTAGQDMNFKALFSEKLLEELESCLSLLFI